MSFTMPGARDYLNSQGIRKGHAEDLYVECKERELLKIMSNSLTHQIQEQIELEGGAHV